MGFVGSRICSPRIHPIAPPVEKGVPSNFVGQIITQGIQHRPLKAIFAGHTMALVNAEEQTANSSIGAPHVENLDIQLLNARELTTKTKEITPCPLTWLQSVVPTPIKTDVLAKYLNDYPRKADHSILITGFKFGIRLGYCGQRASKESPCLKSTKVQSQLVLNKLFKERELGRIAGPFSHRPMPNL